MDKYTDLEIKGIVEDEGLGYAVMHYMDKENIWSEKTKKLFSTAKNAMLKLAKHLGVDDYNT